LKGEFALVIERETGKCLLPIKKKDEFAIADDILQRM
jgi:hypothetical protein